VSGRGSGIELIGRSRGRARLFRAWRSAPTLGALPFTVLLGVWGLPQEGLQAQEAPASLRPVTAPPVTGFLQAGGVASSIGDDAALFLAGGAGIHLGRGVRAWGEGRTMTREMEPLGSPSLLLRFGYGGIGMEWRHGGGRLEPAAAVLAGAGHARVRSRATGVELASENFLVVEPSVALWTLPHPIWAAGVGGGYRWVSYVDRLPGVAPRGLRGWTLSLLVRLQQRP